MKLRDLAAIAGLDTELYVIRQTSYYAPAEVIDAELSNGKLYLTIPQDGLEMPSGGHGSELRGEAIAASFSRPIEEEGDGEY